MITEPITMITDYVMAVVLIGLAVPLYRRGIREKMQSVNLWASTFLSIGVASVLAGITHGFKLILGPYFAQIIWDMTIIMVGVGSLFMLSGTICAFFKRPARNWLIGLAVVKFLIYAGWILTHKLSLDDYHVVIYDYGSAFVIILVLQIYQALFRKSVAAYWLVSGIVISFIASAVQQSGWVLHKHFNYNDMYHIISVVSFYALYRGARLLKDT